MTRLFTASLTASAALLLAAAPALADHHEGADKVKAPDIKGAYEIVGGEKFGEVIPAERLKDNKVVVTADTIAVIDKDSKNLYASTYKLVPAKDLKLKNKEGVWFLDLVATIPEEGKGKKAPGLVKVKLKEKDGKSEVVGMNLIYSLSDKRPAKFKAGAKDLLFKLKKSADPAGDETKKD